MSTAKNPLTLEYRDRGRDSPRRSAGSDVLLRALPVAAPLLTFFFLPHWTQEPFMEFDLADASILVGIPGCGIGIWVAWLVLAIRRPRVRCFDSIVAPPTATRNAARAKSGRRSPPAPVLVVAQASKRFKRRGRDRTWRLALPGPTARPRPTDTARFEPAL